MSPALQEEEQGRRHFCPQLIPDVPDVRRQRAVSRLCLKLVTSEAISTGLYQEILTLCNAAYREDLTDLFRTFGACTHVIGEIDDRVVSHAMSVTRWLQPGKSRPLKTAYIEAVATLPADQGNGYATEVMRYLTAHIPQSYELAALSPADTTLYSRLGWRFWRGALNIRMPSGAFEPTPDERVMVLELEGRPTLDLDESLSAEWREGELW